jgi:1-acyl-sn-glycerol-3-phosphate acyltransferase
MAAGRMPTNEKTGTPNHGIGKISTRIAQELLGCGLAVFLLLPYLRKTTGKLSRENRIYVCNHVSLFDTLFLGGLFFRSRRFPFLVLGDRPTWKKNLARRVLAARVGFLIDRGTPGRRTMKLLREFGKAAPIANLVVFPEGTRGDGSVVGPVQPGITVIARAAGVPLIPIYLDGVANLTSKHSRFRPFRGLRSVSIYIGEEFTPGTESREEFCEEVRARIQALAPKRSPQK